MSKKDNLIFSVIGNTAMFVCTRHIYYHKKRLLDKVVDTLTDSILIMWICPHSFNHIQDVILLFSRGLGGLVIKCVLIFHGTSLRLG